MIVLTEDKIIKLIYVFIICSIILTSSFVSVIILLEKKNELLKETMQKNNALVLSQENDLELLRKKSMALNLESMVFGDIMIGKINPKLWDINK